MHRPTIHRVTPTPLHRPLSAALLALLLVLLAACEQSPTPRAAAGFAAVATVEIDPDADAQAVALAYGGEVLVFRPEAGFALVGLPAHAGTLQVAALDANQGVMALPSFEAAGWSVWGGGWSVWGGGWSVWGGGSTAPTFAENQALWAQVALSEAQAIAPRLGAGIKVAVIDTGVDLEHPALQGRLAPPGEWRDFVDGDALPQDEPGGAGYGHGTAVAGIIAQVAPQAVILPLRVLGPEGAGDLAAVVQAVDWAVAMNADIINLSLGATQDFASLRLIARLAAARGVRLIASSGNSGDLRVTYPAAYGALPGLAGHNIVSVGSVDAADRKSGFSTYGSGLELLAPGEKVMTIVPGQRVAQATGTSFAAPIVSGVLALGLAETGRSQEQTAEVLKASAVRLDALNPEHAGQLGAGRLSAAEYLRQAVR